MNKMQMKYVLLLVLGWLSTPLQVTDATASRMNTQGVYQLLKSGNSELVRSLKPGERELFLAIMSMNQGETKQALNFLNAEAIKKSRLAALIKAEAYRQQSVQAADRAGHYAHAVNDDIGKLKRARITTGLNEANKRLSVFVARVNSAKSAALQPVEDKPVVISPAVVSESVESSTIATVKTAGVLLRPAVIPLNKSVVKAGQSVVVNVAKEKPVKVKLAKQKSTALPVITAGKKAAPSQAEGAQSVLEAIEIWRKDWESRDNDAYLSHYHQAFKTLKHDYHSWASYKRRVNGNKTFIKVALSNIKVIPSTERLQEGEAVLVIFNQRYQSNNFNTVSRKQLYMARNSSSEPWLILYEGDGS